MLKMFRICVICLLFPMISPGARTESIQQWDRGDIRLICHPEDLEFGRTTCEMIREAVPDLQNLVRLDSLQKINLVIASTQSEFDQWTFKRIPDWGIAAAQPDRDAIFLKSPRIMKAGEDYRKIIVHELSHQMVAWKISGAVIPRWLDEGVALYASGELGFESTMVMARAAAAHQLLHLQEIDNMLTFRRDKANLAYRQSLAAVQYLIQIYGEDVIPHLLEQLSEKRNIHSALQSTVGMPYIVFESEWMTVTENKYRWYALLDYRLISSFIFVLLFVTAVLFKKHESLRKQREWIDAQETFEEF